MRAHSAGTEILDSGEFAIIAELTAREEIVRSYVTRVPRFTLLAPSIVEASLDEPQGAEVALAQIMEPFPAI